MPVSPNFKTAINNYLQGRAAADELFAVTYAKENKNLDECCNYIMGEVQRLGYQGMADDEVYKLAVHYYDEDSITGVKPVDGKVVVNHHIDKPAPPKPVELTDEEKEAVRKQAIERAIAEQQKLMAKKPVKKTGPADQPSLF